MRLLLDSTSNHSRVHAEKVIICISSAYFRLLMQNRHSVSHIYYTWFVMAKQILLSHVMFRPRSNVLQFDDGYSRRICFGRIELCCYVKRITQVNITMLCFQLFFFVSSYVIWRVFTLLIGTHLSFTNVISELIWWLEPFWMMLHIITCKLHHQKAFWNVYFCILWWECKRQAHSQTQNTIHRRISCFMH